MRLMIDAPGALTTVQDLGRTGVAHLLLHLRGDGLNFYADCQSAGG